MEHGLVFRELVSEYDKMRRKHFAEISRILLDKENPPGQAAHDAMKIVKSVGSDEIGDEILSSVSVALYRYFHENPQECIRLAAPLIRSENPQNVIDLGEGCLSGFFHLMGEPYHSEADHVRTYELAYNILASNDNDPKARLAIACEIAAHYLPNGFESSLTPSIILKTLKAAKNQYVSGSGNIEILRDVTHTLSEFIMKASRSIWTRDEDVVDAMEFAAQAIDEIQKFDRAAARHMASRLNIAVRNYAQSTSGRASNILERYSRQENVMSLVNRADLPSMGLQFASAARSVSTSIRGFVRSSAGKLGLLPSSP